MSENNRIKRTKIGYIPQDWEFSNIGKYCNVLTGGTPSTKNNSYFNPLEIPWMRSGEIKGYKIKSISSFISKKGLNNSAAKILSKKSVVIALAGQGKTRGTTAPLEIECACNQSVACMVPNDNLDYMFLHYHLSRLYKYIRNITGDVGREGLNLKLIRKFPLILPPLNEQKKIALILSNIDDLIFQTEKIINKLRLFKKGLMQRLFTEGIGHTEFKEIEMGKIPKNWEISNLKHLIKLETGKRAKGGALNDGNVASIGGEHIDRFGNILWNNMKFIPEDFYNEMNQGRLQLNDILVVKDGATTGKTGFIKNLKYNKVAVNEHVFIIRSKNEDNLLNSYLYYILLSRIGQNQIIRKMHGIIGGITRKDVNSIIIPIPNLEEQMVIAKTLLNMDEKIENEQSFKNKLKKIKKGLMQDLLTGKKRVKIKT